MYIYLYDNYLRGRKYDSVMSSIETRLTDFGIAGKIIRLQHLTNAEAVINEEIRKAPGADAAAVRLTVRADRRASTAQLNQVLATLRRLGIGSARMGTEVPN